jgi:hypothetical protein
VVKLTTCFRCPCHIIKAMSKVIQQNKDRVEKKIEGLASSTGGKKIKIYGEQRFKRIWQNKSRTRGANLGLRGTNVGLAEQMSDSRNKSRTRGANLALAQEI